MVFSLSVPLHHFCAHLLVHVSWSSIHFTYANLTPSITSSTHLVHLTRSLHLFPLCQPTRYVSPTSSRSCVTHLFSHPPLGYAFTNKYVSRGPRGKSFLSFCELFTFGALSLSIGPRMLYGASENRKPQKLNFSF